MIIITLLILLANFPVYSAQIESADANYCIDLNSEQPKLVFEKKNNDLKPILWNISNLQWYFKCKYYTFDTSSTFKFVSGIETCNDFRIAATLNGYTPKEISGLPQIIQIQADFPKSSEAILFVEGFSKKEELLLFKNKIINANIKIDFRTHHCSTNIDTTFIIPFLARITGECPKEAVNVGNLKK